MLDARMPSHDTGKEKRGQELSDSGRNQRPVGNSRIRIDMICGSCRMHTLQHKTIHGWRCGECGRVIKEEE